MSLEEYFLGLESHRFYQYAKDFYQENILDKNKFQKCKTELSCSDTFNIFSRQVANILSVFGLSKLIFGNLPYSLLVSSLFIAGGEGYRAFTNFVNNFCKKCIRDSISGMNKKNLLEQKLLGQDAWKNPDQQWLL